MRIVAPRAVIDLIPTSPLRAIEKYSRISHRSEDKQTDDSTLRFIESVVIKHGDWSVVEHVSATALVECDRGVSHEWVRHRLGSYTQESTRFVNYEKKMPPRFIYPQVDVKCLHCLAGVPLTHLEGYYGHHLDEIPGHHASEKCPYDGAWISAILAAEEHYKLLLKSGWRPQEARSVLPNALATKLAVTYNLRVWRHFFLMRTSAEAHPQIREIASSLLSQMRSIVPLLYDDINPGDRQIDNMRKAH